MHTVNTGPVFTSVRDRPSCKNREQEYDHSRDIKTRNKRLSEAPYPRTIKKRNRVAPAPLVSLHQIVSMVLTFRRHLAWSASQPNRKKGGYV